MITALCLQGFRLATATYKFDFCLILSLSRSLQKQQFFLSDSVNWSNDGLAKIFTDVIPRI